MPALSPGTRSVFDAAASEYDAARPSYPASLFDELERLTGPVTGQLILDWGAGTGISSRQLSALGGRVVSLDIGAEMLRQARSRSAAAACVLADGHHMPVRSGSVDFTTFAQAWHWFDPRGAAAEVARVLRPGGYFAAWWNRARAEGEPWFDQYQDLLTASCPGYSWRHRPDEDFAPDWSDPQVLAEGKVEPVTVTVVRWNRQVPVARWITEDRSKSYVIELEPAARQALLTEVAAILSGHFPDGQMLVPYITTLVLARKVA